MKHTAMAHCSPTSAKAFDPVELTLLACDGIIQYLRQARSCWLNRLDEQAGERAENARNLIHELQLGLDYDRGGDIARNLGRLYDFAFHELSGMGRGADAMTYDHLINMFGHLRDAWAQLDTRRN